jgi:hypothetical protein
MLPTQKAEIRMIVVQSQPGQIVQETTAGKKITLCRVAQGVGPEFKSQYLKKKKKKQE